MIGRKNKPLVRRASVRQRLALGPDQETFTKQRADPISTTLGRISLNPFREGSHGFKISSRHPADAVVLTTTIYPGGSTGWHSHPGPAFIVVIRGTLTVYDGNDPTGTPNRYGPGGGYLDPGFGHVHIACNQGTTPVTVVQTYLNVPPGGSPRIDEPAPGNCPA